MMKTLRDSAPQMQEVADAIVKRTEEKLGEVSERDCFEYNGELIDAARMLRLVTEKLEEMEEMIDAL